MPFKRCLMIFGLHGIFWIGLLKCTKWILVRGMTKDIKIQKITNTAIAHKGSRIRKNHDSKIVFWCYSAQRGIYRLIWT